MGLKARRGGEVVLAPWLFSRLSPPASVGASVGLRNPSKPLVPSALPSLQPVSLPLSSLVQLSLQPPFSRPFRGRGFPLLPCIIVVFIITVVVS